MGRTIFIGLLEIGDVVLAKLLVAMLLLAIVFFVAMGRVAEFAALVLGLAAAVYLTENQHALARGIIPLVFGTSGAFLIKFAANSALANPSNSPQAALLGIMIFIVLTAILLPSTLEFLWRGLRLAHDGLRELMVTR